jgi:hypothetical protein
LGGSVSDARGGCKGQKWPCLFTRLRKSPETFSKSLKFFV